MQAARIFAREATMVNGERGHTSGQARRTQADRSAATRAALVSAATKLFATQGYASTPREDIVKAAGVTRGALYHHYADKADLFRAVFEAVEAEVMGRIGEAALASDDPVEQLRLGCRAYLDEALDPGVRRICIIDAPAVLDDATRREIATRYALGMVREVVGAAIEGGRIAPQSVEALSQLLLAAVMAGAQFVATAADPAAARREAGDAIDALLDGLIITS
jgi:AcrR family transcriptional regulator